MLRKEAAIRTGPQAERIQQAAGTHCSLVGPEAELRCVILVVCCKDCHCAPCWCCTPLLALHGLPCQLSPANDRSRHLHAQWMCK